jgi:uncharacterized protein (TIGR02246 family)
MADARLLLPDSERRRLEGGVRHSPVVPSDSTEPNPARARLPAESNVRDTQRTMPEESTTPDVLDVWRRAIEAGSDRDFDALMSLYAPDAVWEAVTGLGTHEGTAEIRRFFEDWLDAYEEFEVELEEILYLGNGVAFGVVVQRGRPVGSTGRVEFRYATVFILVDGMIARQTNHNDIDEARAAAERLAQEGG